MKKNQLIAAGVVAVAGLAYLGYRRVYANPLRNDAAGPRMPGMPAMPAMPAMPQMPTMPAMPQMRTGAAPNSGGVAW